MNNYYIRKLKYNLENLGCIFLSKFIFYLQHSTNFAVKN